MEGGCRPGCPSQGITSPGSPSELPTAVRSLAWPAGSFLKARSEHLAPPQRSPWLLGVFRTNSEVLSGNSKAHDNLTPLNFISISPLPPRPPLVATAHPRGATPGNRWGPRRIPFLPFLSVEVIFKAQGPSVFLSSPKCSPHSPYLPRVDRSLIGAWLMRRTGW